MAHFFATVIASHANHCRLTSDFKILSYNSGTVEMEKEIELMIYFKANLMVFLLLAL